MKQSLVNATLPPGEKEMTMKELILNLKDWLAYLLRKWFIILPVIIIGAICGFFYSKNATIKYQANCTFVLDLGNNGGGSAGGLASLVGMGDKTADLFNDVKNIVWLYTTRRMIENTLFTAVKDGKGKNRLLIDWFMEESKILKTTFKKYPEFANIKFVPGVNYDSLNLVQSTLVGACVGTVSGAKYLQVSETKKTQNIVSVSFTSKDELFSKAFTETLVATVNKFYIETKTKKAREELAVLQAKADSFRNQMDASIYQTASAVDYTPNPNPMHSVLRVEPQKKQIDVQVSSTIYTQLMQNLELSKVSLAKATPLIQVVDSPSLPLNIITIGLVKGLALGILISAFLVIGTLVAMRYYKIIMTEAALKAQDKPAA
ncbi:lipopolysaccharide biosynthesis protein [Taibaiella chishuiensis]|uniref:Subunit length determinant protein n=1 Tax=Taibaiella chishuiensis TaxID=1434707 RepID=A0A2P8DB55_9BACT|nr:lipopolysaccharide biosynthesis protein [Taibaiella chishuiensis]PSK94441.1 hypothetical protein B0I18_101597 [Taibaiella chishuiensis]